jgi:hypothetical protein
MGTKGNSTEILMIGPDLMGLGGISRVVKVWCENGFFNYYRFKYIPSVSDYAPQKTKYLIKALFKVFFHTTLRFKIMYIHTSSYNSIRRENGFFDYRKGF